ncbi:MAG TPA: CBS domain-containing protein [Candidatus Ozemobacteraceae bacterium]|nr:CBS domain-containing protein [Candidatus Ozemobacteraceae bacterium]
MHAAKSGALQPGTELIAIAHGGDLDLLAAARCLLLAKPGALLLHPTRLATNAWSIARRSSWFSTVPQARVDWTRLRTVYLVGIALPKHNPELVEALLHCDAEIFVYAHGAPHLPFRARPAQVRSFSIAAHCLAELLCGFARLSDDDAALMLAAITEKTWAGLSSRVTSRDLDMMQTLRGYPIQPRSVANQVMLGLREGQRGLLNDLITQAESTDIRHWPVTLTVAKTLGNVQDLTPVMDTLWSRIDAHVLVAGVTSGRQAWIYARSRIPDLEVSGLFKDLHARPDERWTRFTLPDGEPDSVRRSLTELLSARLPADSTAGDVMTVSPKCVDESQTVANTHDMMLRFNLMSLVVKRGEQFAGIVTRRDLDRAVQMDLWDSPIAPFVPSQPPFVTRETPVRIVRKLMVRHDVTKIPVIEEGRILGIVTAREVLRGLRELLPPPAAYLPQVEPVPVPDRNAMEALLKRVTPIKVLHVLRKVSATAEARKIAAYAVGGFVRDLLLERPNLDMDVVVIGDALPFAEAVAAELKAHLTVFDRFRTARLSFEDLKIDFTSARREHYAQVGALPQVELGGIANDLSRRDFSINAMALDLSAGSFLTLVDLFGGLRDLHEGRIRILHSFSFLEDPTRMFRAIRFACRFHFDLAEDTQRAFDLARQREALTTLSPKRVGAEITRCLREEAPGRLIDRLYAARLMRVLHPDLADASVLPARFKLIPGIIRRFAPLREPIDGELVHWIGLLASLIPEQAEKLLVEMGMHANRRTAIVTSIRALSEVPLKLARLSAQDDVGLFTLLKPLPLEGLVALVAFVLDKAGARQIFDFLGRLRGVRVELSGDDLIALGIPPGAHMRTIFDALLEGRLRGSITSRKDETDHALRIFSGLRLPLTRRNGRQPAQ